METLIGNIWKIAKKSDVICVGTNIGWRKDGTNVMGAGLAKQVVKKFPAISKQYGALCQKFGEETPTVIYKAPDSISVFGFAMCPTKPLNNATPWLSWRNESALWLIEKSARELAEAIPQLESSDVPDMQIPYDGRILVTMLGCGNGGLQESIVEPKLHEILTSPRCFLVKLNAKLKALPSFNKDKIKKEVEQIFGKPKDPDAI